MNSKFSDRHGYSIPEAEITIRHEAPDWLRSLVVRAAYDSGLQPSSLRDVLCGLLLEAPDAGNWSEFPNIDGEVNHLLRNAEWFQVYDFIELVADDLRKMHHPVPGTDLGPLECFTAKLNEVFRRKGIGWQLVDRRIHIRGPESFEAAVQKSKEVLNTTGRHVALHEIHQALSDLSRRPCPDVTGSIQHAMAALECVVRDVTGDPKSTLGDLMKLFPDAVPRPLDIAISKIWGFTSERGRHLRENDAPDIAEAELIVGLAGSLTAYMVKKVQ